MRAYNNSRTHPLHRRNGGFALVELLIVLTVAVVVTATAIPVFSSIMRSLSGSGDLHSLRSTVVLAKTRAAASFSRARLRANLTSRTFQMELWNKTSSSWDVEGGTQNLSKNVNFGFGSIASPPPNTQASIAQSPLCKNNAGADIANTACIVFNSRGIPVDATFNPTPDGALYFNDGASAQSVTVGRTGLIRGWRRDLTGSSSWQGR